MAGRIPRQFIDELMLRSDIVEVIDARVPLKKAGKDHKACCPFHQEKSASFTVSADKQFYHCFGCGAHGTVIGFLMEYDRLSFVEAVEELARRAGMEIPKEARAFEQPEPSADLLGLMREAARFYRAQLRDAPGAIEYLKQRGITGEVARDFELGYAPEQWDQLVRALGKDAAARDAMVRAGLAVKKDGGGYYDRFRGRVMFPIADHRGRIVGFGGRILDKGEPKYLNSPETPLFHKGRELYGLFKARDAIRQKNRVIVVEGYMDVVALAQFGVNNAVATLGTATTRDHLERLFRHTPEVVFCFDGDRAGREAAWRALETTLEVLHDGLQASFLFLPDGEDPDTLVRKEGREAFEARIGQAVPLAEFMFSTLSAKVDLSRLDGRARLVELAKPLISKLTTGVLSQMMLNRLAQLTQVAPTGLGISLKEAAPAPTKPPQLAHGLKEPPSLMRRAVATLLQHPELGPRLRQADFPLLQALAGAEVLEAIWRVLQEQPNTSTGGLLEWFRGSDHMPIVEKLAFLPDPVGEQGGRDVALEFDDLLQKLTEEARGTKVAQLGRKSQLTDDEKAELKRLVAERREARDLSRSS